MLNTIVLDACTIINLLRIDDDDGFLMKKLRTIDYLAFPEEVLIEVQHNCKKNELDEALERFIDENVPQLLTYRVENSSIKSHKDMFDYVKNASGHKKKENGELFSTVLCLIRSRENRTRSLFFTNDYPAQEEFKEIFECQQIGYITDTAHFLLFLFCNSTPDEFCNAKLLVFLNNLLAEYNKDRFKIIESAIKMKQKINPKNDRNLYNALNWVIDGFYKNNEDAYIKGINFFIENKRKYKEMTKLLDPSLALRNPSQIEKRIKKIIDNVSNNQIFQHCFVL